MHIEKENTQIWEQNFHICIFDRYVKEWKKCDINLQEYAFNSNPLMEVYDFSSFFL